MRNKTAKKLRKLSEAMDMPINDVKRMYHDKSLPDVLAKYDNLVVDKVNAAIKDRIPVDDEQP